MRILRWITVFWPGLPQLWLRGEWSGLLLAGGFSALLNIALVATWGWTEILDRPLVMVSWCGVVLFWLVSTGGVSQLTALTRLPSAGIAEGLFGAALSEYLKGHWFEAELALNQLLEHNPGDLDGNLLLATLLRRMGQPDEARNRLQRLETLDGAEKWQLEIARERQLLQAGQRATAQNVQLTMEREHRLPSAA